MSSLASWLTRAYGGGWGKRHLWHCVGVADTFPEGQIVNALRTQLSWTHLRLLARMGLHKAIELAKVKKKV
ncbi:hypothetical protein [Rufibacter sp. XAAS-G3-1]|uniref:DUF1016 N-terminal domain-containing protein n=1 Tax=Rufibacter sp. XAAS-G3-1 TaxID=2729134 RepID=UPI0015E6EF21